MKSLMFKWRALTHHIAYSNCGDDYARAVCSCGWSTQGYREPRWDEVYSNVMRHLLGQ